MRKTLTALLAVLSVCVLAGCAKREPPPPSVPDLTGEWVQPSEDDWYQVATISEDTIEVFWYLPATGRKDLYWSGTFTPPTDSEEPYVWVSENHYTKDELDAQYHFHRTSREESKTFTYQDGKLCYNVTAGHLRLGYTLERAEVEQSDASPAN